MDIVAREKGVVGERGDCRGYVVLARILGDMRHMSRVASTGCVLREASGDGEVLAALDA